MIDDLVKAFATDDGCVTTIEIRVRFLTAVQTLFPSPFRCRSKILLNQDIVILLRVIIRVASR